jgi:hypothetical protein
MDTTALAKEINDLLSTERRSLLEHFLDATPHLTPATYRVWNEVKKLAQRDSDHAARLSAILTKLHLPERTRPFSQAVGHYHFLSLGKVLSLLVEEKNQHLAAYDRAIRHVAREPGIVAEFESLRADNLSELLALQAMQAQVGKAEAGGPVRDVARSPDLNNAANAVAAARVLATARARG